MTTRTPEQDAIEACIQKYIDGIAQHNAELVAEAFHPQAILSSHYEDEFSIVPAAKTIVDYMKSIPPISESSPDFAGRVISVDQKETMATAIIGEDGLEGLNFITYFHLHRVDGTWLITSKATYGEPT